MYIKRVAINNVRSLKSLIWEIEEDQCPGWHVIIGDNGSGKSTFLKAISFILVFDEVFGLRQNWNELLTKNSNEGNILVDILHDEKIDNFLLFVKYSLKNLCRLEVLLKKKQWRS
jgi:DNA repair exonuclease SbcCD ATPase subunit